MSILTGSQTLGPYRLVKPLGQGGMGEVFLAFDPQLERQVAIKTLKVGSQETLDNLKKRFENEAKVLASLNHHNVVKVFSVGREADISYMVMEYVQGQTLADALKSKIFLLEETLEILQQLLAGIGAAHAKGILHRDIKPANIILDKDGRLVLVDFGISKSATIVDSQLTQEKNFVGTIQYIAPEIVLGQSASTGSDLYSIGVVLFEMLTGSHPFTDMNYFQVLEQIKVKSLTLPPQIERHLNTRVKTLFYRLVHREPEKRYRSAGEVLKVLQQHGEDSEGSEATEPLSETADTVPIIMPSKVQPPNWGKRLAWLAGGAVVLIIGAQLRQAQIGDWSLSDFMSKSLRFSQHPDSVSRPMSQPIPPTTVVANPEASLDLKERRQQLKPLPVGTKWTYRVRTLEQTEKREVSRRQEKFEVKKSGRKGMIVEVAHDGAVMGSYHLDNNRFLPPLKVEQKGREVSSLRIEGEPNQLFPLAVGKTVQFTSRAFRADGLFRDLDFNCRVTERGQRPYLSVSRLVFVVVCQAKDEATYAYHYAPELGLVLREEKEWRSRGSDFLQIKEIKDFTLPPASNF